MFECLPQFGGGQLGMQLVGRRRKQKNQKENYMRLAKEGDEAHGTVVPRLSIIDAWFLGVGRAR